MGGGDGDLKVEAIRGGVRDLKIDDAAVMRGGLKTKEAAAVWGGDGGLKMKEEAAAIEGVDTLKRNEGMINVVGVLVMKCWKEEVEAADDRGLKRKEAKRPADGEMMRLRKEVNEAWDHWFFTNRKLSNVKQEEAPATQEKAQQASGSGNKRKKVVKVKVPKEFVEQKRARPFSILPHYSDEELARSTPDWREFYAAGRFLESTIQAYSNALIAQQDEFGDAEDEKEVTDDDEEVVVEKN